MTVSTNGARQNQVSFRLDGANNNDLYTNVNQLSSEGVKMIYDFRQNPKKYLTIKFELF